MTPLELAAALRAAPPAPDTERSPTNDKPLHPTNGPFRWDPKHGNWVADLNGVFDLLAEQDRERERHAGQVSRLMAERDELRAALSRPPHVADTREGEWQPIETAPKDGMQIDLWCVSPGISTGSDRIPDCWFAYGEWRRYDDTAPECYRVVHNAKNWMPRPKPPRALASGADEKGGEK